NTFAWGAVVGDTAPLPLAGDWNGDNIDTVGIYVPATGAFFLRNSNSSGSADLAFQFTPIIGPVLPLVGDWDGDGDDTVGLYDPASGFFFLRNANSAGQPDLSFAFGGANLRPLAGDWDGDGDDSIGVYNPSTGAFFLRNSNSAGAADHQLFFGAGGLGLVAAVGDFDGNGTDTTGFVDRWTATWWLLPTNSQPTSSPIPFAFGAGGATPIVGDWNSLFVEGGPIDTPGMHQAGQNRWSLRNSNSSGEGDLVFDFPN
ncbi:MAG: hypothetical protein ABIV06_10490, partial [Thermoanaerobaculia bacterium]